MVCKSKQFEIDLTYNLSQYNCLCRGSDGEQQLLFIGVHLVAPIIYIQQFSKVFIYKFVG